MLNSQPEFFGRPGRQVVVSGLRASESAYDANLTLPRHAHARGHLCLVLRGNYAETLRGVTESRGPLTLIFYPPDCPHAESHYQLGRHFILEWDSQWSENVFDASRLPDRPLVIDRGPAVFLALKAYRALVDSHSGCSLTLEQLLVELFAELGGTETLKLQGRPRWLNAVMDRLDECGDVSPSLLNIAESVGLHPSHLSRSFRQWTGCTLGEIRRQRQMERACRRLLSSGDPLSFVAADAGFSDQSHLTRLVRATTGFTPKALRTAVHNPV